MRARSHRVALPRWRGRLPPARRRELVERVMAALTGIAPPLRHVAGAALQQADVKGCTIFAWGQSDIDDRHSELHARDDIGIVSRGRYHSIDPGKLTMVPLFADLCADRIFA